MTTSADYLRQAEETRLLAKRTKDLSEREALLRMAAQWERLAAHKATTEAEIHRLTLRQSTRGEHYSRQRTI